MLNKYEQKHLDKWVTEAEADLDFGFYTARDRVKTWFGRDGGSLQKEIETWSKRAMDEDLPLSWRAESLQQLGSYSAALSELVVKQDYALKEFDRRVEESRNIQRVADALTDQANSVGLFTAAMPQTGIVEEYPPHAGNTEQF